MFIRFIFIDYDYKFSDKLFCFTVVFILDCKGKEKISIIQEIIGKRQIIQIFTLSAFFLS